MKTILLTLMISTVTIAEGDALFGLKWLMSPKQVRAMGVKMTLVEGTKFLTVYKTDSLPKNYSMAETYQLIFYKDSFLGKIGTIELKPLDRGEGFISIRAEAKPEWSQFLGQIKAQENSKDSESF